MAARDYESAPVAERLDLDNVIRGLCEDLNLLRQGKIGVSDAIARSLLAKQIFNGVRIYLSATKLLTASAQQSDETQSLHKLAAKISEPKEVEQSSNPSSAPLPASLSPEGVGQ